MKKNRFSKNKNYFDLGPMKEYPGSHKIAAHEGEDGSAIELYRGIPNAYAMTLYPLNDNAKKFGRHIVDYRFIRRS